MEPSHSPWRAQVLVHRDNNSHKPRMVVDYSRTINKYTSLDAYPLPRIDDMALEVSKLKFYSTFDLKSAYHQIPILESDRIFTAFEADGELLQFTRIPFGVTNGVAAFQRTIDSIIKRHNLKGTFAYMDNITVGGETQAEHDYNVQKFLEIIHLYSMTLNHDKSIKGVTELAMLGYLISYMQVKPDPERLKPLLNLPIPADIKSLRRAMGMFAYYSQWIPKFSEKMSTLSGEKVFPLCEKAIESFKRVKQDIADAAISCPNDTDKLILETDASNVALSASLTQNGRPVAFFSRTIRQHELKHPPIEKEAAAIVEACRKWRHYLLGRRFLLITDQEAVSFIFDYTKHGKTKNDKIMRWRIEMSCFDYDIKYRPGVDNVTADCLTRASCSSISSSLDRLKFMHDEMCHPGVTRLSHFIRSRNLPYSVEDIKKVISACRVCSELKPRFFKPINPPLIKATQPMERLGLDFKGPLPSATQNKYLLVIVDEYSWFPFGFPCKDMTSSAVIKHLTELFSLFGITSYVHSDNGPSLISDELRDYLVTNGIAYSNSTRYNPCGNGQVERYNKTLWKSIQLAAKSKGVDEKYWEHFLGSALHSIRSLLCTSTNTTPHERFLSFTRRTMTGHALPTWLLNQGKVLMKVHAKKSKYDPDVEEVQLVDVNPNYAHVKTLTGKDLTVSLRDLSPLPVSDSLPDEALPCSTEDHPDVSSDNRNPPCPPIATPPLTQTDISTPSTSTVEESVKSQQPCSIEMPVSSERRVSSRSNKGVPPVRFEAS